MRMMTLKHLLLTTAFMTVAAGAAMAQGAPAPKPALPAPHADPGMIARPPAVVRPLNTDPGMTVAPPRNGTATVIPPPGTPGNNPTVVPK
jgi:hypothetical protein